ncbi:MAG: leucine-rich repeat domain-containing protein [Verrucomicrobia bacterium]|nr:leucine-rich repeat domain-containing protein [Verrucomicrobiota bacterium]
MAVSAFQDNHTIEEVVLPDTMCVVGVRAFIGCSNLSEIHIPQSLKKINQFAFHFTGIKELNLPASLEFIGPIGKCSSLVKIHVDPANPNYRSIDGVLYDKQLTTLIYVPSQLKIQKLKVPESVRSIAERSLWGSNLKSIQIPKDAQIAEGVFLGSENVKVIRY